MSALLFQSLLLLLYTTVYHHHHSCMVGRSAAPFSAAAAAAAAKPGRHMGKGRGRGRRGTAARRHWESGIGGGGGGGDWRRRERGFFPTSALPYLGPHFPATDGAEFHLLSGFSGCQTGLPAGRRFKNVLFGGRRLASFHIKDCVHFWTWYSCICARTQVRS